ncbi:hypothetical protein, partial [Klebsiella pneumoniae]
FDFLFVEPTQDATGFEQIDDMNGQGPFGAPPELQRKGECACQPGRSGHQDAQEGGEKATCAISQHGASADQFSPVFGAQHTRVALPN